MIMTRTEIKSLDEILLRVDAVRTHDFDDETGYCVDCGQSHGHVCDTLMACFKDPKIIAISHRRRPPVPEDDTAPESPKAG